MGICRVRINILEPEHVLKVGSGPLPAGSDYRAEPCGKSTVITGPLAYGRTRVAVTRYVIPILVWVRWPDFSDHVKATTRLCYVTARSTVFRSDCGSLLTYYNSSAVSAA
jgi:hypothetical protein